jgi:site-specific recombinase XerD
LLIAAGCSIKAVQEALGHANASETLDTYSHLWPTDQDRIRDAVQALHDGSGVTVVSQPAGTTL